MPGGWRHHADDDKRAGVKEILAGVNPRADAAALALSSFVAKSPYRGQIPPPNRERAMAIPYNQNDEHPLPCGIERECFAWQCMAVFLHVRAFSCERPKNAHMN
jgi:hypothetical protein